MTSNYLRPRNWRGRTLGGIPYRLVDRVGSHQYAVGSVSETYLILARHLPAFLYESFPPPTIINGIPIYRPRLLPGTPSAANIVTKRISWRGHVEGKPVDPFNVDRRALRGTYGQVLEVTIDYDNEQKEHKEKDPSDPFTFLEISASASGQFLSVPVPCNTCYSRTRSGNAIKEPVADAAARMDILVPEIEWTVRWSGVEYKFFRDTLLPNMRASIGKLNAETLLPLYDAPAFTMLFTGFSFEQEFRSYALYPNGEPVVIPDDAEDDEDDDAGDDANDGEANPDPEPENILDSDSANITVSVTMSFLEKNLLQADGTVIGHNHIWREETGRWEYIYPDCTNLLYQSVDLALLFTPTIINSSSIETA